MFTSTADTTVAIGVAAGALVVGPLKASLTGSHYAGVNTAAFDFTPGGFASVQVVQPSSGAQRYCELDALPALFAAEGQRWADERAAQIELSR